MCCKVCVVYPSKNQVDREDAMELLVVSFAIETSTSSKISVCICAGQAFFESTSF